LRFFSQFKKTLQGNFFCFPFLSIKVSEGNLLVLVGLNISNQNKSNFQGKIKFSRTAYEQLPLEKMVAEDRYVGFPWLIEDTKMLKEGFSDGAQVCLMGFIKPEGAEKGRLLHCIPAGNPFGEVARIIVPIFKTFERLKKPIEGILVGANFESERSMEQAYNFMRMFDLYDVRYSAFVGQKSDVITSPASTKPYLGVDMFASAPKDEYILNFNDEFKPLNLEDLQKRFHIIKKAPQDEFIFDY